MREVVLVAAVADNGVIGHQGRLPWHLPADLQHFRQLTDNGVVVMGRKTAESIGRPLKRRRNLLLSRALQAPPEGFELCTSVEEVLKEIWQGTLFVIGGQQVYEAFLPHATRAEITHVEGAPEGDTVMPPLGAGWQKVRSTRRPFDERNPLSMEFASYTRR